MTSLRCTLKNPSSIFSKIHTYAVYKDPFNIKFPSLPLFLEIQYRISPYPTQPQGPLELGLNSAILLNVRNLGLKVFAILASFLTPAKMD